MRSLQLCRNAVSHQRLHNLQELDQRIKPLATLNVYTSGGEFAGESQMLIDCNGNGEKSGIGSTPLY